LGSDDPRPKDPDPWYPDDRGTACAGVACATGTSGASGVAPKARLMPIRLVSGSGSLQEAARVPAPPVWPHSCFLSTPTSRPARCARCSGGRATASTRRTALTAPTGTAASTGSGA
jgi:hypothetical protein